MANSKDFIVKKGIQAGANSSITGTLAAGNTSITGTLAAGNTSITGTLASGNTTIAGSLTFSTITAGTWNGSIISGQYGGTGVNNSGKTITLGGNITTANSFMTSGNFAANLIFTAATNVTLPTTGTLATLAGSETLTNKTLTSPTISGGALSGTFTGSPLFSGTINTNNRIIVDTGSTNYTDGFTLKSGTVASGNPGLYIKKLAATDFNINGWNGTAHEGGLTLTFPAGITASANLSVGSVLSVTGNTSIGGNLTVTGNLTISKNYSPNATRHGIVNTLTLDNSESLSAVQTGIATLNDIIADTQNSSIYSQSIIGAYNSARSGTLGGSSNSSLNLYYGAINIASANTSDPVYKYTQQLTGSENIARVWANTAIANTLYGIIARARVEVDGGSAVNAIGVMSNPGTTTTGSTVTNAYAFLANFNTSGTITNKYGLYINDNTAHNIITGGLQVGGAVATGTSLGGIGVGVVSPGAGMIQTSNNVIIGGNLSVNGAITAVNLTLSGNLTINGTTTTVNSTTVTLDDPILTLGGDTAPTVDDNKDRGIEFRWHNGTSSKSGFFGYDDSTGYFTFIPDATNTSEVFSGTKGVLDATALLANNASYLGGTIASGYQTTAGLSANVATLTANNASYLNGQLASYYTNATNISTGTLAFGRLPSLYHGTTLVQSTSTNQAMTGILSITMPGSTSGTAQIIPPAVAGTGTVITLPGSNSTLATVNTGLNQFAATTSSELAGIISDETGSGNLVFSSSASLSSPTINGGALSGTFTGSPLFSGTINANNMIVVDTGSTNYTDGFTLRSGTIAAGNPGLYLKKGGATAFNINGWNGTTNEGSLTLTFPAGITASANLSVGSVLSVTGNTSIGGNLTVTGNLTINGTTTTVNSTTVTLDDPILTLGGDTAPTVDDNKDRGIEFRWHNGTAAKVGFFGYDDSTGYFTFIPDATNTSEVFSGTKGILDATALLANNASYLGGTIASGYQTTAGLSANVATLTANNSTYLGGTIASGYQTTAGLSANVATLTANNAAYLGGTIASGYQTTAGLSASVATLTANNSTYLNGQLASYYTNATNISTGTLAVARGGTGLTLFTSGGAVYASNTSALTTGTLPVTAGGTGVTTSTGTGSNVLSIAPTFSGNTTFNSTTLVVDSTNSRVGVGTAAPKSPLHIDVSTLADLVDTVRISHNNSGATFGPALVIQRDSASPATNDAMGYIAFRGNNSAGNASDYAWIQSYIRDTTATSEDGELALAVKKNGAYAEIVNVSNTGIDVTGNVVSSAQITGNYTALANGTTAMALATNHVVKVTPTATATFTTTVAAAGSRASIIILTSGASSYTITFGSGFKTTGTLATGTTTAKTFVVDFVSDGTSMIEVSRTTAM